MALTRSTASTAWVAFSDRHEEWFQLPRLQCRSQCRLFGRTTANFEIGGNDGQLGYYLNVERFDEDGWRDQSESDALNLYGSLSWHSEYSAVNLNLQHGRSDLIGNGAAPVELLTLRREAIFTGPDITENKLTMTSLDFAHEVSASISLSGNLFWRENDTDAFNGDGTEFAVCAFTGGDSLIEGLEEDDIEELGIDDDDLCEGQFSDAEALEDFLNNLATSLGEDDGYNIEGFEDDELSGTGVLTDDAINNISNRVQQSFGGDFQWTLKGTFAGYEVRSYWEALTLTVSQIFARSWNSLKSIRSRALLPVSAPEPSLTTQQL